MFVLVKEMDNGASPLLICDGGKVVDGFIESDIDELVDGLDDFPIDLNFVLGWVNLSAHIADKVAVDLNSAGTDEFIRLTAGADALVGDVFVDTDEVWVHGFRGINPQLS